MCHVLELRLGSPFDKGMDLPPTTDLDSRLTPNTLDQTLQLQRKAYWKEINPLLERWRSVNDARCPECARLIRVQTCASHTPHTCATGDAQFRRAPSGSPANSMAKTTSKTHTTSRRVVVTRFTSAYVNSENGLGAGSSSRKRPRAASHSGRT